MHLIEMINKGLIRVEGNYWYPTVDDESVKTICENHNKRINSMIEAYHEKTKQYAEEHRKK